MSRTGKVGRQHPVKADYLYQSTLVTKLINRLMQRGKKSVAEKIVYTALAKLNPDKTEARNLLKKAIDSLMPEVEVRSRRVGGATYQVPTPVRPARSEALALRWLHRAAQSRKGMPMAEKLGLELKDVIDGKGIAVKKKDDVLRMAEANKAFAHFRW